jgi:hypothetical protein
MERIEWKEKPGLYNAIVGAGHYVEHINGESLADDAVVVQAIIDSYDPLPSQRAALLARVAEMRGDMQRAGMAYVFPDGQAGTIQLRDQQDIANVTGQTTAALVLQAQGVTEPVLSFRDEQNETHAMTPAQMIGMGMAVSAFITATYAAKWAHDNAIAQWNGAAPYDIATGWPE